MRCSYRMSVPQTTTSEVQDMQIPNPNMNIIFSDKLFSRCLRLLPLPPRHNRHPLQRWRSGPTLSSSVVGRHAPAEGLGLDDRVATAPHTPHRPESLDLALDFLVLRRHIAFVEFGDLQPTDVCSRGALGGPARPRRVAEQGMHASLNPAANIRKLESVALRRRRTWLSRHSLAWIHRELRRSSWTSPPWTATVSYRASGS